MKADEKKPDTVCPICQLDNNCAVATGAAPESCWCQRVTIDAKLLAAVPTRMKGKNCICPQCAKKQGVFYSE